MDLKSRLVRVKEAVNATGVTVSSRGFDKVSLNWVFNEESATAFHFESLV